jgi:predicted tellurium resistance membrane protein TerC
VFDIQTSDLVTIALLIVLEGILSADNAMVLAIRVLSLPKDQQVKALRYGMLSAFTFRATATAMAAYLIALGWVKLVGGLYLLYLGFQHFRHGQGGATSETGVPNCSPLRGAAMICRSVTVCHSSHSLPSGRRSKWGQTASPVKRDATRGRLIGSRYWM